MDLGRVSSREEPHEYARIAALPLRRKEGIVVGNTKPGTTMAIAPPATVPLYLCEFTELQVASLARRS